MRKAGMEKVAYDYEQMFRGLFADVPSFVPQVREVIKWCKLHLQKRDRITWWLKWLRLWAYCVSASPIGLQNEGMELTDEELQRLSEKYKGLAARENARMGHANAQMMARRFMSGTVQTEADHYLSLPIPEIQNVVWDRQSPEELFGFFRDKEEEWKKESRGLLLYRPHEGDRPVVTFGNGWAWWLLDRGYCPDEAKAMGHCGNVAGKYRPNERILSLRRSVMRGDREYLEPHLTFILDTDDDSLGEMKGRGNEKPAPQYHPYIIKLLESSLVKKVKGGGYLPEHNFRITDLPVKEQERLMELKPSLGTYLFRLRKEGKTPELVEDVGQALRFGHDDWKPSLDGYAMGQWDNVEEYAQQHGNDTAQWIVKVMSGGEFLDIDPYSPKDNMEQVLDSCKPETLALVLRNLKHFHPRAVVAWMAEGNEDTYGEDAAKVDAADEMACAAFLAGIDLTETSLAQSSAIVQLVEDQDLDEASGNLLGAWGDAARSGTEGEMTKYFKSAMEDLLGTTSDWGTFLVQDGNSFWESPIYEVMPFAKAVELADGETDDVWAWTENEGRLQGHEMDLKVDEPYSGFNEWDEQYADERVKETFHFKEDPELAGKKKRTRVRKPVNK
jgi:hypothetical protein